MSAPTPPPRELRIRRAERLVVVEFACGTVASLPAEYLRVESPSAEVQGHAPDQRAWIGGKSGVTVEAAEPVGNYAVRLLFSDGHHTGIYSWALLRQLWDEREARWARYLAEIAARGLHR